MKKTREYNYVAHDCRNSKSEYIGGYIDENGKRIKGDKNPDFCNNRWIGKDLTLATTQIPTWAYCEDCCKKLGIDFENQKPKDYRTEEQQKNIDLKVERLKVARAKNQNIKADI